MPGFAASLSMMFGEHAFLDRFDAAANSGFEAVEFLFPYEECPEAIAARLARTGLAIALFNLPAGDFAAGERGLAALPERRDELARGLAHALRSAEALGVRNLHLMAGNASPADPFAAAAYRDAVALCADELGARGLQLLLEPINGRDMPG